MTGIIIAVLICALALHIEIKRQSAEDDAEKLKGYEDDGF